MILTDEMLMAAFRYRETKLWEYLDDSMVFAFRLSDGDIGYCSVMGHAGEHLALGFYRGAKGFNTYLDTIYAQNLSQSEFFEVHLTFECVNCDFMNSADANELDREAKARIKEFAKKNGFKIRRPNGWPDFTKYDTYKIPFGLESERDAKDITEALNAATALSEKIEETCWTSYDDLLDMLGFDSKKRYPTKDGGKEVPFLIPGEDGKYKYEKTELPAYYEKEYATVVYDNTIVAKRIKALNHEGNIQCRAIHAPGSVRENGMTYYPSMMLCLGEGNKMLFPVMPRTPLEEDPKDMLDTFASILLEMKTCPTTIFVSDLKTKCLLADFCKKAEIKLQQVKSMQEMDNACNYIFTFMM